MDKVYKIIKICSFIAIGCILAMVIGRTAESWSQNHYGAFDFLLYGTLLCITVVYLLRGMFHHRKNDFALKVIWRINRGDFDLITSLLFGFVLIFGVNSIFDWVQFAHITFTALAIISASIGMVSYFKNGVSLHGAILSAVACGALFLFAYLGNDLTTAEGEMIIAFPIVLYLLSTTKKE